MLKFGGLVAGRMVGVNITQLSLIGTFLAAASAYGADMKMIHISSTDQSFVTWCRSVDNPSTALGYDGSTNCVLAHNIIIRPARLARPGTFSGTGFQTGGAGGSGIGIAVGGAKIQSMHVHNNMIIGTLAAGMTEFSAGSVGRNGINIESSSGTPAHPAYRGNGIIIESNTISGFYNGIVDSGALCTKIVNNNVRNCVHGIKSGSNGISAGRPARDTIITGNDVRDGFTWNAYTSYGITVNGRLGSTADDNPANLQVLGRTRVINNVVTGIRGGYGVAVLTFTGGPLGSVSVENNLVTDCDLSGIWIQGPELSNIAVRNNVIISNGRLETADDKAPIRCDIGTIWNSGWLAGNSYWEPEAAPTQDAVPTFNNAVLTNVLQAPGVLLLPQGTVANLPTASATYLGVRATVSDSSVAYTSANVGATVAGGGANTAPVFCNGTNWIIG